MKKHICLHGHFYQPPRENPWLEDIELQDSAYPNHDWNERITAECYAPNTSARVIGAEGVIEGLLDNYTRINFNFGPTLLSWMEKHRPQVYEAIISSDKNSIERFSGHGSAIAQCYNHLIMPLADERTKRLQVAWGIKDFEHRFGRQPEGMWLPETAVDMDSLEALAEHGVKYTILAPRQAKEVRDMKKGAHWYDVSGEKVDTRYPYLCRLNSGKEINIFFYDGFLSKEVAFGDILRNGRLFAEKLMSAFNEHDSDQLVSIATDGETYGHHHFHGDMALAYCLNYIENDGAVELTNYGKYLEKHPPQKEVRIIENSSWSCAHGIERWRADCGCNSGMNPGWSQKWRAPLRGALDWLKKNVDKVYADKMSEYTSDPWSAFREYIDVVLDRSDDNKQSFLLEHFREGLNEEEKVTVFQLLEAERMSMLMFTSCGWFFDEVSGIETMQIIQYAARVLQLMSQTSAISLEEAFLKLLAEAKSNIPEQSDAAAIYRRYISPGILDLERVAAHYAVFSLFRDARDNSEIYCYNINGVGLEFKEIGPHKIVTGKAAVRSQITGEKAEVIFAMAHFGGHNIIGGVRPSGEKNLLKKIKDEIIPVFMKGDISGTVIAIKNNFDKHDYSLWHLFKDQQREIIDQVLDDTIEDVDKSFRSIKERHYSVINAVKQMGIPLPKMVSTIINTVINIDLVHVVEEKEVDLEKLGRSVEETRLWDVSLDKKRIAYAVNARISDYMERLKADPSEEKTIKSVYGLLRGIDSLGLNINLWEAENIWFDIARNFYPEMRSKADSGDVMAAGWIEAFNELNTFLKIQV